MRRPLWGLGSGFVERRARVSHCLALGHEAARFGAPRRTGRSAAGLFENRRVGAPFAVRIGDEATADRAAIVAAAA